MYSNLVTFLIRIYLIFEIYLLPINSLIETPILENITIANIYKIITEYNQNEYVLNEDIFGPLTDEDIVVVIQVHRRIDYLNLIIQSHSLARGIERALLIFSHDYYDDEINELVQSITFCKIMQIFYPYSSQIYPDRFPGPENQQHGNCNISNSKQYCTPKITQMKHHWWWKINTVFSNLTYTKNFNGLVMLLEDDHYVIEDYLYTAKLMDLFCQKAFCRIINLGHFKKLGYIRSNEVIKSSDITNLGLTFNRTTWEYVKKCSKLFCSYDDYNWDWTLKKITEKCLKPPPFILIIGLPRIYHIGKCGVHHKTYALCDINLNTIMNQLREGTSLFPEHLRLNAFNMTQRKFKKPFGGWSDKRDQQLCLEMTL